MKKIIFCLGVFLGLLCVAYGQTYQGKSGDFRVEYDSLLWKINKAHHGWSHFDNSLSEFVGFEIPGTHLEAFLSVRRRKDVTSQKGALDIKQLYNIHFRAWNDAIAQEEKRTVNGSDLLFLHRVQGRVINSEVSNAPYTMMTDAYLYYDDEIVLFFHVFGPKKEFLKREKDLKKMLASLYLGN